MAEPKKTSAKTALGALTILRPVTNLIAHWA